jgi:hypothetical protein
MELGVKRCQEVRVTPRGENCMDGICPAEDRPFTLFVLDWMTFLDNFRTTGNEWAC